MEKQGIIFDIKRYAIHDGPGIRTTIFFKGCPMNCWWCHNPESQKLKIENIKIKSNTITKNLENNEKYIIFGKKVNVKYLISEILKDQIFFDESGGGVTLSGGEPMIQIEFLYQLLRECKRYEINTVIDTAGYASTKDYDRIYSIVDLFLYDLKIINEENHLKYTGVSNKIILKNLKYLSSKGKKIQLRIPLIPDITDKYENLVGMIEYIKKLKNIPDIRLLPYNYLAEDKKNRYNISNRLGNLKSYKNNEILEIYNLFKSKELNVKIGG